MIEGVDRLLPRDWQIIDTCHVLHAPHAVVVAVTGEPIRLLSPAPITATIAQAKL